MSAQPSKLLNKSICTVRSISTFAKWNYGGGYQTCAICRQVVNDLCLDCQSDPASLASPESVDCQVIWGECNHCFHQHCMSGFLKKRTTCPLCCADWVTTQVGDGPSEKQKEEEARKQRIESRYRSLIDIHQILSSGQAKVSKVMQTDWSVRVLVENFVIPK